MLQRQPLPPSGPHVAGCLSLQPGGGGKCLSAFLHFPPHSPPPSLWVRCSAMDMPSTGASRVLCPAGTFSCPRRDADSFSCRFSLQLKKLLLSPSHVPPSCEAQRDGSARRPGTPKSRPARPCTKVLVSGQSSSPSSAHLSGAILKEVTEGRRRGVWAGSELGQGLGTGESLAFLSLSAWGLQSGLSKTFRLHAEPRNVSISFESSGVRPFPAGF